MYGIIFQFFILKAKYELISNHTGIIKMTKYNTVKLLISNNVNPIRVPIFITAATYLSIFPNVLILYIINIQKIVCNT